MATNKKITALTEITESDLANDDELVNANRILLKLGFER